jgi:hypothetical protein
VVQVEEIQQVELQILVLVVVVAVVIALVERRVVQVLVAFLLSHLRAAQAMWARDLFMSIPQEPYR